MFENTESMKYLVTVKGKNATERAEVAYDDKGVLTSVDLGMTSSDVVKRKFMLEFIPIEEAQLVKYKGHEKVSLEQFPENLSFTAFWEHYDYKVGKKARAETLWGVMTAGEKSLCMVAISRYKKWHARNQHVQKLYPETFLSQRRWENEYN